MFKQAKEFGQSSLAITDHGTMAAVFDARIASKKYGVKYIPGLEAYFTNSLDKKEREYLELCRCSASNPRIACLYAHGENIAGKWCFFDGEQKIRVQTWINRHENDYPILIICSCNPGSLTPTSKAVLLIPDNTVSGTRLDSGAAHLSIVHPEKGELEYIIEYEISLLKNNRQSTT